MSTSIVSLVTIEEGKFRLVDNKSGSQTMIPFRKKEFKEDFERKNPGKSLTGAALRKAHYEHKMDFSRIAAEATSGAVAGQRLFPQKMTLNAKGNAIDVHYVRDIANPGEDSARKELETRLAALEKALLEKDAAIEELTKDVEELTAAPAVPAKA